MWYAVGQNLQMVEEDFGLSLPVIVEGTTLGELDSLKITIKNEIDGETILEKDYHGITDNTVDLTLTQAESALLPVGCYVYRLDWYQNGSFMCNLIKAGSFKVVNKA